MATIRVPRHATRSAAQDGRRQTRPLADWGALDAYVLLGDPGAGKSWAFEHECEHVSGVLLKARDVVAGIAPTDITGRTVFIDGLDEVRAGATDGRVPFDAIRKWLHDHGKPRLRLSCREADWHGSNDTAQLAQVAPGGQVAELHLDPLRDTDIAAILGGRTDEVPDAQAFLEQTERAGLKDLLRNPLLLELTIGSATHGVLPRTRTGLYDAACRQLAREHNAEHQVAHPAAHTDRLLHQAGRLCALLLLSGKGGISRPGTPGRDAVVLADLPEPWGDAAAVAKSKLFQADGDLQAPRHRSIAEFLGGRALAECINQGLPLGRVLALMQGIDGFPVEPMRGLWAWLAVHHLPSRDRLIAADPLGFVLNGDAASLSTNERLKALQALRFAAEKDPWFRNAAWISHPFAPLATADMAPAYEALLRDPRRDRAHFSFMDCVFDALRHGERMPSLAPALEAWIEDGRVPNELRLGAYAAWKHCADFSVPKAMGWLRAIKEQSLPDGDGGLRGALLTDLYPTHLTPARVFDFWQPPRQHHQIAGDRAFWEQALWEQTPREGFADLAAAWLQRQSAIKTSDLRDHDAAELPSQLLAAALEHAGDHIADAILYEWLGMCLDAYGLSRLEDRQHFVRTWLAARPDRMKAVMAISLSKATPDEQGRRPFWRAQARLHGATLPRDWFFWLLHQASAAPTCELAEFCFSCAAQAAITPTPGLDSPSMDDIEAWVEAHKAKWPDAEKWLEAAWSTDWGDWRGDEARRQRQVRAQQLARDEQRKSSLLPHIPSLLDGTAPAGLWHQIAVAHEHGFSDLRGETPLERVRSFLASDEATAQAVIEALPKVLDRSDLPTVEEAIALAAKGRHHPIRPAALLAARLAHERDANAPLHWLRALVERLVAYYLTDGTGRTPDWFQLLAHRRPGWVAPVLVQYARPMFKRKGTHALSGLWELGREAEYAELARQAVPSLLEAFPLRASEAARHTLNRALLPALASMTPDQAASLIRMKLNRPDMDPAQRICWWVADLPYRAEAAVELAALVGRNERKAVILGAALDEQDTLARVAHQFPPLVLQHLIEVLAPITSPDAWQRSGIVTAADRRARTVLALLSALSSNPEPAARDALLALEQSQGLHAWKTTLQYSLRTQAANTREASFQVPDPATVARTLDGATPANPADLRALVMQHLGDLQADWRGANTFALKLFWRETAPRQPKIENDCRDLLLDQLRARLKPLNILVGRECSAAQDKRADLCVEFMRDGQRLALPIEIKKQDHEALWTAWRDQLQRLYTIDPAAQGHGLYLVLWFGVRTATHPEGLKPRDPEQLRAAVEARVPVADRHRLMVQVLDLSSRVRHHPALLGRFDDSRLVKSMG